MSTSYLPSRLVMVFAAVVLMAAAVLAAGYWYASRTTETGVALVGGPFAMTDQDGRRVTEKDFLGKPMLVSFGFTFCPDVCPGQLLRISEALTKLGPAAKDLQPVFVTIDPARDTPEALKSYLSNFAPGYVGLTGSAEDVAVMARAYRVYYAKVDNADAPGSYTMDHSALIYLMDAKGRFLKHFTDKSGDAAALAQQIETALKAVQE